MRAGGRRRGTGAERGSLGQGADDLGAATRAAARRPESARGLRETRRARRAHDDDDGREDCGNKATTKTKTHTRSKRK